MSEKLTDKPLNEQGVDPVDIAARDYQTTIKVFKRMVRNLKGGAAQRVMVAFIEYPLFDKTPVFMTTQEETIFKLGLHLQNCKLIMHAKALETKIAKEKEDGRSKETVDADRSSSDEQEERQEFPT